MGNAVSGYAEPEEYVSYGYDSDWRDQLESYTILKDSVTTTSQVTYDNQGNPTQITNFKYKDTIYTKAELDWEGRQLVNIKVYNSSLAVIAEVDYTYNDQGIRIQKIIDDSTGMFKYEYKLSGSQLISEVKSQYDVVNSEWDLMYTLVYSYDIDGSFIGLTHINSTGYKYDYIVVTNIQGDVTHLLTAYGDEVVHYEYDAYGNIVSISGSLASLIGAYNSLRYRSYIYDEETAFYYLQSRYYNPEITRFINADGLLGKVGNLQTHNMYAYCANNPVMYADISGEFAVALGFLVGLTLLEFVIVSVVTVVATVVILEIMNDFYNTNKAISYFEISISNTYSRIRDYVFNAKKSKKARSTDKPSYVNKGMISKSLSAQQNARNMCNTF
ncbi:MAG: RHS repeat-associated core domain-containing protein [Candidatus Izimaplasma sp.]|nr:RHS repeat-associated core domain-containing protein [Candidatus Izimaplasma bacterium]